MNVSLRTTCFAGGSLLLLALQGLPAQAQTCDPWHCKDQGSFEEVGVLTDPGPLEICEGESVSPAVTGTRLTDGTKARTCCEDVASPVEPPGGECTDEYERVGYSAETVFDPDLPATFKDSGTFLFAVKVKGSSQDYVCADIDAQPVADLTVVVEPAKCPGDACYVCDSDGDGKLDVCRNKKITAGCVTVTAPPFGRDIAKYTLGLLNRIPFLDKATYKLEAKVETCDCCKPPVITGNLASGAGNIEGSIDAKATVEGEFPVPALGFVQKKIVNLTWFRVRVSGTLKGGVTLKASASVGAGGALKKLCDAKFCVDIGVKADGSIGIEVGAQAKLCYKRYGRPGNCPINVTLPTVYANAGLSGSISWNSCTGLGGQACIEPLKAGVKTNLPWIGEWSVEVTVFGKICYPP